MTLKGCGKHNFAGTSIYMVWAGMIHRCESPTSKDYPRYGGRGITVCKRWREDFMAFYEDIGYSRPEGCTLDRVDNNGPYSPDNCRWSTPKQQGNNRRTNRNIEFSGETKTLAEWAAVIGIAPEVLAKRIRKWPLERALTEAPHANKRAA